MIAIDRPLSSRFSIESENTSDLIYEILDGEVFYRKGYKQVIDNKLKSEDIIGCSSYQWAIIEYLLELLFNLKNKKEYRIATNEPRLHIDSRNNVSGDIMIFDKKQIPGNLISSKYINVPSILHMEVDISIEEENLNEIEYLEKKINKIISFGTKRMIWVFTISNKVLEVVSAKNWVWYDINENVLLLDDVYFDIGEYLESEGVTLN